MVDHACRAGSVRRRRRAAAGGVAAAGGAGHGGGRPAPPAPARPPTMSHRGRAGPGPGPGGWPCHGSGVLTRRIWTKPPQRRKRRRRLAVPNLSGRRRPGCGSRAASNSGHGLPRDRRCRAARARLQPGSDSAPAAKSRSTRNAELSLGMASEATHSGHCPHHRRRGRRGHRGPAGPRRRAPRSRVTVRVRRSRRRQRFK